MKRFSLWMMSLLLLGQTIFPVSAADMPEERYVEEMAEEESDGAFEDLILEEELQREEGLIGDQDLEVDIPLLLEEDLPEEEWILDETGEEETDQKEMDPDLREELEQGDVPFLLMSGSDVEDTDSLGADLDSPEVLFGEYVEQAFSMSLEMAEKRSGMGMKYLSEPGQRVYKTLKKALFDIAEGKSSSTKVNISMFEYPIYYSEIGLALDAYGSGFFDVNTRKTVSLEDAGARAFEELRTQFELRSVLEYLMLDCPYELYWFDKTEGIAYNYNYIVRKDGIYFYDIDYFIRPLKDYAGKGQYAVDTKKTSAATVAAANAQEVVRKAAALSDVEKLYYYKDTICELTSYNEEALENGGYGDPWQMIYVFDGDPQTQVVCEGYSKAFQYLCDNSDFVQDIRSILVYGVLDTGDDDGGHMWNVCHMPDQKNYLADVTNSDTGAWGEDGSLFLAGMPGTVEEGYDIYYKGALVMKYRYDESLLASVSRFYLELSDTSYGEEKECLHEEVIRVGEKKGTCLESGYTGDLVCSSCHAFMEEGTVIKMGHNMCTTKYVAPTCTKAGKTVGLYCGDCGLPFTKAESIPKLGHSWSSYTVTKEATVLTEGSKKKTCKRCSLAQTSVIAKLPATMTITNSRLALKVYKSVSLAESVSGLGKGDSIASWTSDATGIVTVSRGKVTAKGKTGTAHIIVKTKGGAKKTFIITVQKGDVKTTALSVNKTAVTVKKGKTFQLIPTVKPITSTQKVTYTTSNKSVAVVSSTGVITAKKKGTATITVKSGTKYVKVKVTVTA